MDYKSVSSRGYLSALLLEATKDSKSVTMWELKLAPQLELR